MRIDAHQHFWQFARNAADFTWMTDEVAALRQDFMPTDLAPLRNATGFAASVAVQAREVEAETDFLLALADQDDTIAGVVGWTDLCADDLDARLDRWSNKSRLKGMRMLIHDRADPDFADSADHVRGVRTLAERQLSYDLLLRTIHLPAACRLVDQVPAQHFVIDHIAKPRMDGQDRDAWEIGITEIARRPNVMCKLSGLVTEANWQAWHPATFAPYLDHVLESFGPNRLMIGSDWPVCTLAASYPDAMQIVIDWCATLSDTEQAAMLGENCARFYRIPKTSDPDSRT